MNGETVSTLTLTLPAVLNSKFKSSRESWGGTLNEDQDGMKEEVKRITMVHSEESQKLDLMKQMQQARQRQALQRKLLERRQGWLPPNPDVAGIGLAESKEFTRPRVIPFGGAKATTQQDSFRGLDSSGSKFTMGGEDVTASGLASRGLGLQNVRRK
jgi:hypothetical protein